MNLVIRRARESDRRSYDWQPYYASGALRKPWVITVDGALYVVIGKDSAVLYQNGSEAIPNLMRIWKRYVESLQDLYDDQNTRRVERTARRYQETMEKYQDAMRRATG